MVFALTGYMNAVVFRRIRTPTVMAYFALIPLSGLLLGRRSMNIFAGICVATILTFFI